MNWNLLYLVNIGAVLVLLLRAPRALSILSRPQVLSFLHYLLHVDHMAAKALADLLDGVIADGGVDGD